MDQAYIRRLVLVRITIICHAIKCSVKLFLNTTIFRFSPWTLPRWGFFSWERSISPRNCNWRLFRFVNVNDRLNDEFKFLNIFVVVCSISISKKQKQNLTSIICLHALSLTAHLTVIQRFLLLVAPLPVFPLSVTFSLVKGQRLWLKVNLNKWPNLQRKCKDFCFHPGLDYSMF